MKVLNQSVEMVPVGALRLHPRNVNNGDVGAIHESIKHNGFYGTIVAQRSTGYVLAGNHRLQAAQHAGATEVPVVWVDVDDDHALRILLADNRTTRLGSDDPEALARLLQEIADTAGTLDGTGYSDDDLDELLADLDQDGAEDDSELAPDQTGQLTEQYQVLVACHSEWQQAQLLEQLAAEGYECRALIS